MAAKRRHGQADGGYAGGLDCVTSCEFVCIHGWFSLARLLSRLRRVSAHNLPFESKYRIAGKLSAGNGKGPAEIVGTSTESIDCTRNRRTRASCDPGSCVPTSVTE